MSNGAAAGDVRLAAEDDVRLHVRIKHADVDEATFPVLVGHMRALPIQGALADLDELMSGQLVTCQRRGRFPGKGEAAYFASPVRQPPGVVVVDLGETGGLTRARLVRAVAAGVSMVAPGIDNHGLSSVLVGCGTLNGLSEVASLTSIIEGVLRALRALPENDSRDRFPDGFTLEIIEVNSDTAGDALNALHSLEAADFRMGRFVLDADSVRNARLQRGRGGLRGARPRDARSQPWDAVYVKAVGEAPAPAPVQPGISMSGRFARGRQRPAWSVVAGGRSRVPSAPKCEVTFTALGRAAQLDEIRHRIDLGALDSVRRADPDAGRTRYLRSLLVPDAAMEMLDDADNLLLLVDAVTARFPWEVALTDASFDGHLRGKGLLRQFVGAPGHGARRPVRDATALIAGGWAPGTPPINETHREVYSVAGKLRTEAYEAFGPITLDGRLDTSDAQRILECLTTRAYRIVHLALHGQIDDTGAARLMVGHELVIDADFVDRMQYVPDLVFLNCCHSGSISEVGADLARALFAKGVRAVVAAGWNISDASARLFAETFYDNALDGQPFGEAVWRARAAVLAEDGDPRAWGAFQCYGDPGFMLTDARPAGTASVASEEDLLRRLTNVERRATRLVGVGALATELDELYRDHVDTISHPMWPPDGDGAAECLDAEVVGVLSAFGDAFQALGPLGYRRAISCYRHAITAAQTQTRPELRFHTVEELAYTEALTADLVVRLRQDRAALELDESESNVLVKDSNPQGLLTRAGDRLQQLAGVHGAPATHAYLGAVLKRQALVLHLGQAEPHDVKTNAAIDAAIDAFREAERLHRDNRQNADSPASTFEIYYLTNRVELEAVRVLRNGGPADIVWDGRLDGPAPEPGSLRGGAPGLWDWARAHEVAVARLLVALARDEPTPALEEAVSGAYEEGARAHRVTPMELAAVAANLGLLADLAPGAAGTTLGELHRRLPSVEALAAPPGPVTP